MTTKNSRFVVLGIFAVAVLLSIAFGGNSREHTAFDSQKWKTDIASRYDMPHPVVKGMRKKEVIETYGNPDGVDSSVNDATFIYLMPLGNTKGIYAVMFDGDLVVDTRYEDSGDDSYPAKWQK